MWVSFKDRKPQENISLITRSPGYYPKSDCFEDWRKWKIDIFSYNPPPSHWWDGDFDFDLSVKEWKESKQHCGVAFSTSSE